MCCRNTWVLLSVPHFQLLFQLACLPDTLILCMSTSHPAGLKDKQTS